MYGLVHNNQIQVGPRQWNYMIFKEYLDEAGLDSTALPRVEPNGPVVGVDWKILPVTNVEVPPLKNVIEQLAGPTWKINTSSITGKYTAVPENINIARMKVKDAVTRNRYDAENSSIQYTLSDDSTVVVSTSRADRLTFQQLYNTLADSATITIKFPGGVFKTITKEELGAINTAINNHVQITFDWEAAKYGEIDSAELAALENFDTDYPE